MSHDYSDHIDESPSEDKLAELSRLVEQQRAAEERVSEAGESLKKAQGGLRDLNEHLIPDLMRELKINSITTQSGLKVEIKEQLRVSVPKKNKPEAYQWVDDNGGSALMKRGFVITFSKEEEKFARKFERDCAKRKMPLPMVETLAIEPSTLKKFLSDHLKDGTEVPLKTFGAYHQKQSIIAD